MNTGRNGPLRISHFRVEEQLQRDELGYFFRAVDEQLDRPVVLRVVRAAQVENIGAPGPIRVRIRANAKAAAQVSHPNLVTIYEFRALAETDIVVMERVEGRSLQEMRNDGRRWTVVEMARMLARAGDALGAAHAAGLVHGNVNAANIRVRPDGRLKLLDLGIPKLDTIDDRVPHDPSDDVRGLARMASELLGPPVDMVLSDEAMADPLGDPVAARAHFGFLAPVLKTALRDRKGYASGAAFRDAVLQALEMATGRSGATQDFERGFSTHVLGPDSRVVIEDALQSDSGGIEPVDIAARGAGPRLVLPPDLAKRAPSADSFDPVHIEFLRRTKRWYRGLDRALGPKATIAVILAGTLIVATVVVLYRVSTRPSAAAVIDPSIAVEDSTGVQTAAANDPQSATEPEAAPPPVPSDDTVTDPVTRPGARPVFSAVVRVNPPGTQIRALAGGEGSWTSPAEVGVASGDTLILEFSHPGYVTQRRAFTGTRLSFALEPDSVVAQLRTNLPADAFLATPGGEIRLGTTNIDVRLPTGTHRIVFRSPGQPEWEDTFEMSQPGRTYEVSKLDYVTIGSFVASVSGSWARVSVDGGLPQETPARFDSLAVGRHVVTLTRSGFATIVDTVLVAAGQVTRRTYEMRR